MAGMRATISGRVGGGPQQSTEVSAELYDRYQAVKAVWGFSADDMATLATDGGRLPLSPYTVLGLVEQMEKDALEMKGEVPELVTAG